MNCFSFIQFFGVGLEFGLVFFSDFHRHNLFVTVSEDFDWLLLLFLFF